MFRVILRRPQMNFFSQLFRFLRFPYFTIIKFFLLDFSTIHIFLSYFSSVFCGNSTNNVTCAAENSWCSFAEDAAGTPKCFCDREYNSITAGSHSCTYAQVVETVIRLNRFIFHCYSFIIKPVI